MISTSRPRRPLPIGAVVFFLLLCWPIVSSSRTALSAVPRFVHGEFPALDFSATTTTTSGKVATSNQLLYDIDHYDLYLEPDFDEHSIQGTVRVDFTSLVDGLDKIDLDLFQDLGATGARNGLGQPLTLVHENDIVTLQLLSPLAAGETSSVIVDYEGTPEPAGFLGMQFLDHAGTPILATLSEPYYSRSWWPCKDLADDKATMRLRLLAPEGFYCASNGVLTGQEVQTDGRTLFTWEESYPISSYNISVAVTNFVGWTETWTAPSGKQMEIEYKVFPEDLEKTLVDFASTRDMLDLYSQLFGEYPFVDDKYGMAEFIFDGAMEHQTMTSYGQHLVTGDGFFERLVGHEMAHQWFGNLITVKNWDEVWLHEGFAVYAEALWIEHKSGFAAMRSYMRSISAYGIGFWGPVSPPTPLFGGTVYQKGAWILHMLRHMVGDNDFFQILQSYTSDPSLRFGAATIQDFIDIAENVTSTELSWFFDEWLYRVGRPDYDISWRSEAIGESYQVIATIRQVQDGDTYRMPLDFVVESSSGSQTFTVWNDGAYQVASFMVNAEPLEVQLDPDDFVLRWNQSGSTATSTPHLSLVPLQLLPNVPNPFNPSTSLRFVTPGEVPVQLRILDARGRTVRHALGEVFSQGQHEWTWRGRDDRGNEVSSGVYTVIIETPGQRLGRRITLVK